MWLIRFIAGMLENSIMLSCLVSWFLAQICKAIVSSVKQKRIDLSNLFRTGGMPSSHAAVVASLSAAIYLSEGISSLFVFSLVFLIIVIHDAYTLRMTIGKQTSIIKDLSRQMKLKQMKDFRGVLGHTMFQIVMGMLLGAIVSITIYYLRM